MYIYIYIYRERERERSVKKINIIKQTMNNDEQILFVNTEVVCTFVFAIFHCLVICSSVYVKIRVIIKSRISIVKKT